MTDRTGLKYVTGSGFIVGVPARDLTVAEVEKYDRETLIASGCYVDFESEKTTEKSVNITNVKKKSGRKPTNG